MATVQEVLNNTAAWACPSGPVLPWLRTLPDGCVHEICTSPPYWGLRSYLPKDHPDKVHELGTEGSPEEYVAKSVEVYAECRRVLHPSGVFFLNIGDSYANDAKGPGSKKGAACQGRPNIESVQKAWRGGGLKKKELVGIPWMLAFALRQDGWWLRGEQIWQKLNGMMESVADRPVRGHEHVFLLTKRPRYFYDSFATRVPAAASTLKDKRLSREPVRDYADAARRHGDGESNAHNRKAAASAVGSDTALLRSVWSIPVARSKEAHFAVMPERLALTCVRAGTSKKGVCPACGEPWRRVLEKVRVPTRPGTESKLFGGPNSRVNRSRDPGHPTELEGKRVGNRDPERHVTRVETVGWRPGCECHAGEPIPAVVLDPFAGSGTTLKVAVANGRRAIGCDLNPEYVEIVRRRMAS